MPQTISFTRRPIGDWVRYLHIGDLIWLEKESEIATVGDTFKYKEGDSLGTLILIRLNKAKAESWYMTPIGNGFDGMPLVYPIIQTEDNMTTNLELPANYFDSRINVNDTTINHSELSTDDGAITQVPLSSIISDAWRGVFDNRRIIQLYSEEYETFNKIVDTEKKDQDIWDVI